MIKSNKTAKSITKENNIKVNDNLDVLDYYENNIKKQLVDIAEKNWEESPYIKNINYERNKSNSNIIYDCNKKIKKTETGKTVSLVIFIFSIIATVIFIVLTFAFNKYLLLWLGLAVLTLILFIIFLCKFLSGSKKVKEIESIKQPLLDENYKELKNLYKTNVLSNIYKAINDVYPHINLCLSTNKSFESLTFEKILFAKNERQVVESFSGTINDNPFIMFTYRYQKVFLETFSSSESFPYTEHYTHTNSEGRTVTGTRTAHETLTASVTKTNCIYPVSQEVCYIDTGEVQKDLEFNSPNKSGVKKLKPMENKSFDKLFPASRNDEVGFRMVFTPLAQENMVKLLNSNKIRNLEYSKISSIHSINSDIGQENIKFLNLNKDIYNDFDYENIKNNYIKFYLDTVSGIYFTLAPFLTIPLFFHFNNPINKKVFKDDIPSYAEVGTILSKFSAQFLKASSSDAKSGQSHFITKNNGNEYKFTTFSHYSKDGIEPVIVSGYHTGVHTILVPFTEHFPTKKINNTIYVYKLKDKDKSFIEMTESFFNIDKTDVHFGKYKDLIYYCGMKKDMSYDAILTLIKKALK